MSNVATVTPYQPSQAGIEAAAAVGAMIGAIAEAFGSTDTERAVVERYRAMARQDRLSTARLDFRLADNGDLLAAARGLGYACRAGDLAALGAGRPVELVGAGGASMVLRRSGDTLSVLSAGGQAAISKVVRRVTLDRAQRHLETISGGKVSARQLANGEVELQAREARPQPDGAATVTTRIDAKGVVHVDIANIRGGRCEQVLSSVAAAVGGEVDTKALKPDYYAAPVAPGEPVHIGSGG